jgi:thiol-disulfide isomerase/thioredoxin
MRVLLFLFLLTTFRPIISAHEITLTDGEGNDIPIEIMEAAGDLVMIWLVDHDEPRPLFDNLLQQLVDAGIEIWRVDLLQAYYLPRSAENVRTLTGQGVATIIQAAHRESSKKILLASYDRMPLPLLRGAHHWQGSEKQSRLIGAILFYPNLFGPAPIAGEEPQLDPILNTTNLPLVIYQPELGSQRWRLPQVLSALWKAGSATYAYLAPGVKDWFIMGEVEPDEVETRMVARLPGQLSIIARLLDDTPKSTLNRSPDPVPIPTTRLTTLIELEHPREAPALKLSDHLGHSLDLHKLRGKVILVNFWATWCPPCVEEIPSLNRLQTHYRDLDVGIVSIDFRETAHEIETFIKERPVDFPILMDTDGQTSLAWRVFSFPSSFIIDRQGRVRYSANRGLNWDSKEVISIIDGLLAEQ